MHPALRFGSGLFMLGAFAAPAALLWAACSPPSREGLFGPRVGAGAVEVGGGGGAPRNEPGGAGGGSGSGGSGGSSGGGSSGGGSSGGGMPGAGGALVVPEPADAGSLDARAPDGGDAATGGEDRLGCLPEDRADCDALIAALAHRYSFDGSGSTVADAIAGANASVRNGEVSGAGSVVLSGDEFVELPSGIVSQLGSATFEAWVNWAEGQAWQRIFDFGSGNASGSGETYLFLTPRTSNDLLRAVFRSPETSGEVRASASSALPAGVEAHVAVVVDEQAGSLGLFLDGDLVGSAAMSSGLSALADVENWLGRSHFETDPGFEGSLLEFRIYAAPLSAAQLRLSFDLGPDAPLSD